jgi:transcriptional regulator with XRE-family HTH domain
MRRMMLGMSQEKLGDALGLTFQQVQKYEKGSNRIGASRVQQISLVLRVPVSFFFEGAPPSPGQSVGFAEPDPTDYGTGLLSTSEGLALARAFMRFPNVRLRRRIVDLVEEMASQEMAAQELAVQDLAVQDLAVQGLAAQGLAAQDVAPQGLAAQADGS